MDSSMVRGHATFRDILQCIARPGGIRLAGEGRDDALERLAECLFDPECTLGSVGMGMEAVVSRLSRRTGSPLVDPGKADFVLAGIGAGAALRGLRTGTPDYPDRGATVVYLVRKLSAAGGGWTWTGPGIAESASPCIDGIAEGEWEVLAEVNSSYPLGLDALFIDDAGAMLAMPRSTRLERKR